MLKVMRESIPQSGVLGSGPGKEVYQSYMDQEIAKKMSQRGGIGLGEKLYRQVLRREEKGNAAGQDRQAEAIPKVAGNESR